MTLILEVVLAYLVNLASNERSSAIGAARERKVREALEKEDLLKEALASTRSIREEVRAACMKLARSQTRLGVTPQEEPVWRLLSDDLFQADLTEWLMAGAIEEGDAAKDRLVGTMELALSQGEADPEQVTFLRTAFFDALERVVFASPVLARWRHQLSLDYLREQVVLLRQRAEEAAGVFSTEKQQAALDRYCEKALASWDIIDLSNLPEGDIHMATQKLLLRQLYMPLRIEVEPSLNAEEDAALARIEEARETRRQREAGHHLTVAGDVLDHENPRVPVGERLAASPRLVVLGDPGSGKTTMLRWMATAYLLRHRGDPAFQEVPDTETLPSQPWIPVLIRCRDLGEADLCRSFVDFLSQHLKKTELLPDEAEVMRAVVLERIAKGKAILLVDGLDEITNPRVRMMFCQELERTAARYPDAPIVVTSRIVGYRDMPYRMGSGFEHRQIAELNRGDKDLFADRWVEITEQHHSAEEKAKRARELLDALHSNDRIERLTGNPMLLTTLALVKRKVGKLPNKRTKLYAEAVSVLLNWNPRYYETIEEDEAIPQLEYIAYEMCRRGVQRLADDEIFDLLERLRAEYPNVRAVKRREPSAFLALLEARSSILIKSGSIWEKDKAEEKPAWEFRHLTFQEYLAARALVDGRYPNRDKIKPLASEVAPLADAVALPGFRGAHGTFDEDVEIPESWRETLRLLVADCKDDDVDNVLIAILRPVDEDAAVAGARPRAILAALCLADEPNVSEESAQKVLATFASAVGPSDGTGTVRTSLDRAAGEVACSMWAELLKKMLVHEFQTRPLEERWHAGGLLGMTELLRRRRSAIEPKAFFTELVNRLQSADRDEITSAALTVMAAAFEGEAVIVDNLIESLFDILAGDDIPGRHASAWALGWLSTGPGLGKEKEKPPYWHPKSVDVVRAIRALDCTDAGEYPTGKWIVAVLDRSDDIRAVPHLLRRLDNPAAELRKVVASALGELGDKEAVAPLLARLDDGDSEVREAAIEALGKLGDTQAVAPLLARLDDENSQVREAAIEALGKLGDIQATVPLLTKLKDQDSQTRRVVLGALARLRDRRAVTHLLAELDDTSPENRAAVAAVLHVLGEEKGRETLREYLKSRDVKLRMIGVSGYACTVDSAGARLLSRDLDAAAPWLDPQAPISRGRVASAAARLGLSREEVRSLYKVLAADLDLKLGWSS